MSKTQHGYYVAFLGSGLAAAVVFTALETLCSTEKMDRYSSWDAKIHRLRFVVNALS
jgi:hypothetical protein